ncbi:MAG: asparagine synthase (glutamine-hydrolyzing) [Pseudomonadota bacterium]
MCGIAGFYSAGRVPADGGVRLQSMADRLAHRGPDGEGTYLVDCVGLAHRRLAVIDLSERGAQPMVTDDANLVCTFNGEIYNFRALRDELRAAGHVFHSDSDTEVLLHGYREWGDRLPERLYGMFAFAIFDRRTKSLFLARDRFGKKPLCFGWCGDDFVFASEHKALLTWPGIERKANLAAIHDYLSFKFSIGEATAFCGIHKLPPASTLLLTREHNPANPPRPRRFWALPSHREVQPVSASQEALEEEFFELFDASIAMRLIADVPVGAFLSGGVDSTAVVNRAAEFASGTLKTFSAGFADDGFDETGYAQRIATQFGTEHHAFIMDESLAEQLPRLVWDYSEPFSDPSAIVTTALAREVRKHVTVALSGDGGDEIFLGYQRYAAFANTFGHPGRGPRGTPHGGHLERLFGPVRAKDVYARSLVAFRDVHKEWGYGPALAEYLFSPSADRLPSVLDEAENGNAIVCAGHADVDMYLPDDLMVKTDIASMAWSLEARCPFLDHNLAEWAAKLPQQTRVFERNGRLEMKALLKRALEPRIDEDILYRQKMGFRVPVARWLRGPLKEMTFDLLTSGTFRERGLFRPQFVDWLLDSHASGQEDHNTRIWSLLCLEIWYRTFIDTVPTGPIELEFSGSTGVVDEVVYH